MSAEKIRQTHHLNYLNELFFRIQTLRNTVDNTILNDELNKHTYNVDHTNYHIIYTDYNDYLLCSLTGNNTPNNMLKYADSFIETLSNHCKFTILNQKTLNMIVDHSNNFFIGQNAIELLKNVTEWNKIEVTKYHINTKHISLFCHNDEWFIAYNKTIKKIDTTFVDTPLKKCNVEINSNGTDDEYIDNDPFNIFIYYLKEKQIILDDNSVNKNVDANLVYHFLIKHNKFRKFSSHNSKNNYGITILWITNKNNNFVISQDDALLNFIVSKIQFEKKLYFSCLDELLTSLDVMCNDDMATKNIQYGGYHIKIFNDTYTSFTSCFLSTEIYTYIMCLLPTNKNQYKNFLELYQYDRLTEVLPYLHKYPADVVRRINMSIKTLSKEILNIYHSTRNKQNCDLYKALPIGYKKILYNLHKIYVNQKYGEFIIKSNDVLREKKSISVDIVYSYLKEMKNGELINLFQDRISLIKELQFVNFNYSDVLYVDNIDILTQTELMSS